MKNITLFVLITFNIKAQCLLSFKWMAKENRNFSYHPFNVKCMLWYYIKIYVLFWSVYLADVITKKWNNFWGKIPHKYYPYVICKWPRPTKNSLQTNRNPHRSATGSWPTASQNPLGEAETTYHGHPFLLGYCHGDIVCSLELKLCNTAGLPKKARSGLFLVQAWVGR